MAGSVLRRFIVLVLCVTMIGLSEKATAENTDFKRAWDAAKSVWKNGPASIPLRDQAMLHLPNGYLYIPSLQAVALSKAMGNDSDANRLYGLVTSTKDEENWFIYIEYFADGHVSDDEAKDWDVDELLNSLREGTKEGNKFRESRGFKPIETVGWLEKPAYDSITHQLVYSALVREKDNPTDSGSTNYNTYALGRDGHFELTLVGDANEVEKFKGDAKKILSALEYNPGKRYQDYNASTDKLAGYGLAALVGGAVAKKAGLIALIGAFIAKSGKILIIGGFGVLAVLGRFFGIGRRKRKKDDDQGPVERMNDPPV